MFARFQSGAGQKERDAQLAQNQVGRGRHDAVANRPDGRQAADCAGRSQQMPDHRLG